MLRPSVAWSCQVAPRSAARAALPRQRGAPDGGNHTPKTERPQDFLRSPAISRSIAFGLLCCGLLIQGACIVANLPPGATMPQEAHGAVGGHGCRRRDATLPCATERCAHPRLRRLAVLQRNGEIRGIDRKRGSVRAGRTWPHCGVTLPLRSPCELKALPVSATPGVDELLTPPIWLDSVNRTSLAIRKPPRARRQAQRSEAAASKGRFLTDYTLSYTIHAGGACRH